MSDTPKDFLGQTVLVAGASRGIGQGLAQAFAAAGASVWLGGRDIQRLQAAAEHIAEQTGVRPNCLAGDFSAPGLDVLLDGMPPPDVMVVNYGDTDTPPGFDTSEEAWERLITANLSGPARLSRHVARSMAAKGGGTILFIGSICGREVLGAPIAYNVGKAGLRALSKTMARELGPSGVRVNLLHPGNILYEGGRWAAKQAGNPDGIRQMLDSAVPLRRFGTPDDIAHAALFLCSAKASFITGAELVVDGGQTVGI